MIIYSNCHCLLLNKDAILACTGFTRPILPSRIALAEGTSYNIPCSHNNPHSFGISTHWLDSNGAIISSNSSLKFNPVSRKHNGVYTCILKTDDNRIQSSSVVISVQRKLLRTVCHDITWFFLLCICNIIARIFS